MPSLSAIWAWVRASSRRQNLRFVLIIGKAATGNGVGFNADSAGEVSNASAKLLIHLANNFLPTTLVLRKCWSTAPMTWQCVSPFWKRLIKPPPIVTVQNPHRMISRSPRTSVFGLMPESCVPDSKSDNTWQTSNQICFQNINTNLLLPASQRLLTAFSAHHSSFSQ